MNYHKLKYGVVVKGRNKSIHDESASIVTLTDEGGGLYVRVEQHEGSISVVAEEWPLIRDAIQEMLNVAQGEEAPSLAPDTGSTAVYISREPKNERLGSKDSGIVGFQGLEWSEVSGVKNIEMVNNSFNALHHNALYHKLGDVRLLVETGCGEIGNTLLRYAARPSREDNWAFKIEFPNGSVRYFRGVVTGPNYITGETWFTVHVIETEEELSFVGTR